MKTMGMTNYSYAGWSIRRDYSIDYWVAHNQKHVLKIYAKTQGELVTAIDDKNKELQRVAAAHVSQ